MLFASGKTVIYSAFMTILVTIAASMLRKSTRMGLKDVLDALFEGTRSMISVAIACASVGIIIGVASLTGFGLSMASAIVALGGKSLFLTLAFTMVACMILGMGLPSIPAYLITATMAAPALVRLGIDPLVSHLFVFYFAMFANIRITSYNVCYTKLLRSSRGSWSRARAASSPATRKASCPSATPGPASSACSYNFV